MTRLSAEIINRYQHRSFLNRMRMEVRASVVRLPAYRAKAASVPFSLQVNNCEF